MYVAMTLSAVVAIIAIVAVALYVSLTDPSRGEKRIAALTGLLTAATPALITVVAYLR